MSQLGLDVAARTHVGLVRDGNEDAWWVGQRVFAVADGMGGHAAGEVASALAIEAIAVLDGEMASDDVIGQIHEAGPGGDGASGRFGTAVMARVGELPLVDADRLGAAVSAARLAIVDAVHEDPNRDGMGTTLVGLVLTRADSGTGADSGPRGGEDAGDAGLRWLGFNVGDSRLYRCQDGALTQVSTDHSEVQELVELGWLTPAEAAVHPLRSVITRALGQFGEVEPDVWDLGEPTLGQRWLLCSDGMSDDVPADAIAHTLGSSRDAETAAEDLVLLALEHGGRDNITVVVVDVIDIAAT